MSDTPTERPGVELNAVHDKADYNDLVDQLADEALYFAQQRADPESERKGTMVDQLSDIGPAIFKNDVMDDEERVKSILEFASETPDAGNYDDFKAAYKCGYDETGWREDRHAMAATVLAIDIKKELGRRLLDA